MRHYLNEKDINRIVSRVLSEQELGVSDDEKIRSTKPLTVSEYQKKIAEIVSTCKSNPQTCSNTVSMMMNQLPPNDKQAIETLMVKDEKKITNEHELKERCWPGYTQKGMKTMFGKRYPNCVKKKK
jgi:hypothetical protein